MAGKWLLSCLAAVICVATACGNSRTSVPVTPTPDVTMPAPAPEPSATPVPAPEFQVSGTNHYRDPVGSLRFLLEVRNVNDFAVEDIRATVLLRDADGRVVASRSGYARLDLLKAREAAPVVIVFFLSAPAFFTYDVEIQGRRAGYLAESLHRDLRVVDHVGRVGKWVPYEVLGSVENTGAQAAGSVRLTVTCYDADGRVTAVATARPAEMTIPPGGASDFLVSIGDVGGEIGNCKVQVEGLAVGGD